MKNAAVNVVLEKMLVFGAASLISNSLAFHP